ncbi:hypothetical protein F4781DRAFT_388995 [Annulohypoxylon bovei var. microspora]|nr:hypothetical protein F4781DRAFT_388995 [Annulohypoxylon bovei var. microspora]
MVVRTTEPGALVVMTDAEAEDTSLVGADLVKVTVLRTTVPLSCLLMVLVTISDPEWGDTECVSTGLVTVYVLRITVPLEGLLTVLVITVSEGEDTALVGRASVLVNVLRLTVPLKGMLTVFVITDSEAEDTAPVATDWVVVNVLRTTDPLEVLLIVLVITNSEGEDVIVDDDVLIVEALAVVVGGEAVEERVTVLGAVVLEKVSVGLFPGVVKLVSELDVVPIAFAELVALIPTPVEELLTLAVRVEVEVGL